MKCKETKGLNLFGDSAARNTRMSVAYVSKDPVTGLHFENSDFFVSILFTPGGIKIKNNLYSNLL